MVFYTDIYCNILFCFCFFYLLGVFIVIVVLPVTIYHIQRTQTNKFTIEGRILK